MQMFLDFLKEDGIILADGAMGTMLIEEGLASGECPESFNFERPEVLKKIAVAYLNSGAQIIQTNTFGASPLKLKSYNLENRVEEINRKAILAIKEIVVDKAYLAASIGPSGKLLKPYGDTDSQDVFNSYKLQFEILNHLGVDLISIETMTDINELLITIRALRSVTKNLPVMASMTFDKTPRGYYTIMGVNIAKAAKALEDEGVDVMGSNCGHGIENMIEVTHEFKKHTKIPITVRPNAGLPKVENDRVFYPHTPEFMAEKCRDLVSAGVKIIGGCCGTTPEHIQAISEVINPL